MIQTDIYEMELRRFLGANPDKTERDYLEERISFFQNEKTNAELNNSNEDRLHKLVIMKIGSDENKYPKKFTAEEWIKGISKNRLISLR